MLHEVFILSVIIYCKSENFVAENKFQQNKFCH